MYISVISSMVMRSFYLLLFILCLFGKVNAQEQPDKFVPLERMSAYSWAGKSGLLSNNITSAIQSKTGYLWLTTYNGILRFDGFQAVLYDRTKLQFLKTDGFRKVYEASDSTLYFASQGGGIVRYDGTSFKPLTVENGDIPQSVSSMIAEDSGNLWIGSNNEGLYKVQGDSIARAGPEALYESTILDLLKDDEGNVWVATEGQGLYVLKINGTVTHYSTKNGLMSDVVNCLTKRGEEIFVGTQSGFYTIDKGRISAIAFMETQSINYILPDNEQLWVGSNNGLGRVNFKTGRKELISEHEASPLTRINWLTFDREGSLWVCTGRDGLIQMRLTGISNYTSFDGLSSNKINIITEANNHDGYYVGCDDGNIFYLTNNRLHPVDTKSINNTATATGIRDILEDENGDLWIASYSGVVKKTGSGQKYFGLEEGLHSTDVRRIFKDKKGNIWLGSRSGGLAKIVNDEVVSVFDKQNLLQSNFILCIEEDNLGNIYVGTHSGGLSIIAPDQSITTYNITKDDAGLIIFNIHLSDEGQTWVVSNMGLFMFENGVFKKITLENDYAGTSMFDWVEDDQGNAWITTTQGLINIERSALKRYIENPEVMLKSRLIDHTDGMSDKECTPAVRSLKTSNGKLFIPTIKGISVIDPSAIKENNVKPKVYVNSLATDKNVYKNTGIAVPPGNTRYMINFTALSFVSPQKVAIKYKLDDFDENYIEVSNVRHAEYTNLAPGQYTFHVIAANKDGVWNKEGATFTFTVKPVYYQTAWFYLLITVAISLALFGLYKWRVKDIEKMNQKLRKVNSELDSFVYSASHDLRSPLASLLGLIDLTKSDKGNIDVYLEKMQSSVIKLDAFIGDIIDFSSNDRKEVELSTIDFHHLMEEVISELEYMDEKDEVRVNVSIKNKGAFQSDRRRVAIVLRNLISNAFKYSDFDKENPMIDIQIVHNSKFASIEIKDNGIGIEKKDIKNIYKMFYRATASNAGSGLGLYIVKETVEKLYGTITVDSKLHEGSTFGVYLPHLPLTTG